MKVRQQLSLITKAQQEITAEEDYLLLFWWDVLIINTRLYSLNKLRLTDEFFSDRYCTKQPPKFVYNTEQIVVFASS